jgi:hypothetical protein
MQSAADSATSCLANSSLKHSQLKNVTFALVAVSDCLLDSLRYLYTPAHRQRRKRMNEQIKELAEQAGFGIGGGQGCQYTFVKSWAYDGICSEEVERFAELIVGKFVEICNQAILHNEDMLPKFNKPSELYEKLVTHGAIVQAEKLSNEITEYFGVNDE